MVRKRKGIILDTNNTDRASPTFTHTSLLNVGFPSDTLRSRSSRDSAHSDAAWSLAWAGTDTVLSTSADGILAASVSSSGERIYSLPQHPVGITSVTTSTDGSLALYNTLDGTVGLVNIEPGSYQLSLARTTRSQSERPWTTSLAPDGQTFASTGKSGGALIHSADSDPSFGETRLKLLADGPSSFGVCCAYVSSLQVFEASSLTVSCRALTVQSWQ
jgi:WD repeat-containing protein 61